MHASLSRYLSVSIFYTHREKCTFICTFLHRNAKHTWLENANLFTLHFSQIVANFARSSGKVLQVQVEISGEERAALLHSQILGGVLGQTRFSFFLQRPLIRCWWERVFFLLVGRRGKGGKSLRFCSTAELGMNGAILEKPLCLGMRLPVSSVAFNAFQEVLVSCKEVAEGLSGVEDGGCAPLLIPPSSSAGAWPRALEWGSTRCHQPGGDPKQIGAW